MSSEDASASRFIDVSLEFLGSSHKKEGGSSNSSVSSSSKPVIKKLAKSASSVRLIVQKLPAIMDAGTADHVMAVLLDELERLPVPGRVAKIVLSNLRFTESGAQALKVFFTSHASTIRHVVLNNLISRDNNSGLINNNSNNSSSPSKNSNKKGSKRQSGKDGNESSTDDDDTNSNKNNRSNGMSSKSSFSDSGAWLTDSQRVADIIGAFEHSPVTVLDLSRNRIYGSILWRPWKHQQLQQQQQQQQQQNGRRHSTSSGSSGGGAAAGENGSNVLKQLILDSVDIDHKSWITLATTFDWSGLDDLHVVVDDTLPSDEAVDAANSIIRNCTKISSLRWIQKQGSDKPLPWTGLRDMAVSRASAAAVDAAAALSPLPAGGNSSNGGSGGSGGGGSSSSNGGPLHSSASSVSSTATNKHYPGASLKHLVLEGPGTPDFMTNRDLQDLTTTLKEFTRLKTLKLRHLGLVDLSNICSAIRTAKPPLEVIDFSYNEITSAGCRRLADLMRVSRIVSKLGLLVMNDNRMETDAARDLLETFGAIISLDNNPGVDFTRIVTDLLTVKNGLERERDDLRLQLENRAYEMGGENAEILKRENRRLREERDVLSKAFSVMGVSQQVEEHRRLLDRIQRLEDMVVLGAVFKDGGLAVRAGSGQLGGGSGGMSSHESLGSKNASRRRINVNDLPLDRLTQAAAAAAAAAGGRNSLGRSHSNRSTTTSRSANSSMGGSIGGAEMDEVAMAVTESPHYTSTPGTTRGTVGASSVVERGSSNAVRTGMGRSYSRAPTSPNNRLPNTPSLQPMMDHRGVGIPTTPATDSTVMPMSDRPDRRTLSSNLRHSSYPSNHSPATSLGGRRGSNHTGDLE